MWKACSARRERGFPAKGGHSAVPPPANSMESRICFYGASHWRTICVRVVLSDSAIVQWRFTETRKRSVANPTYEQVVGGDECVFRDRRSTNSFVNGATLHGKHSLVLLRRMVVGDFLKGRQLLVPSWSIAAQPLANPCMIMCG